MSYQLWKYFIEDDVDSFRQLLANATYTSGPQRSGVGGGAGNATFKIGSPAALATSPNAPSKFRKSSGHIPIEAGGAQRKSHGPALTRADINAKDAFGRTILHHAASSTSPTAVQFVAMLLEVPFLDLYVQDVESGWTALHRALYFGNVNIAQSLMHRDVKDATDYTTAAAHGHAGGLVKIKDHEGHSPFEVFGLTIASRTLQHDASRLAISGNDDGSNYSVDLNNEEPSDDSKHRRQAKPILHLHGDEVYAFGSNKNLTLGLGDEDDRQYPERLTFTRPDHLLRLLHDEHKLNRQKTTSFDGMSSSVASLSHVSELPAIIRNSTAKIQDVVMSKRHTAVLTDDPISNLFVCGFGPGGRLGTGDETTRFSYTCVQTAGLASRKVVAVALGQDHTIAISSQGEVYTWGSSRFGQLGYALPETSTNETPTQLTPRQLYGHIKKEHVVGAAASSIHSVVFTTTALYTFGKNEGQLGLMDADARSLECQVIPRRVGVSILQSPVQMVSAIDSATSVLLENHDLIVFTHYGFTKVVFQLESFTNYFMNKAVVSARPEGNKICKVTSGGNTICALSTFGEVFTVDVPRKAEPNSANASTTNPAKARNALPPPSRVWSIKKAHMSATDVAVGQDGSVILCTESGSVWRKEKRANIKALGRRDAGAARSKDYKFVRVPNLTRAIAVRSNAFGAFTAITKESDVTREQITVDPPTLWADIFSLLAFHQYRLADDENAAEPQLRFWTGATKDYSPAQIKKAVILSAEVEHEFENMLARHEPLSASPYDVWITSNVTEVKIPVHSFLIKGRSPVLRHALAEFQSSYYFTIPDVLSIEYGQDGQIHIQFQGADFLTILNLVFYLYAESVVDVWHYTSRRPQSAARYRQVRAELMKFANVLDLRQLERAVRVMGEPARSLNLDMESALQDQDFYSDCDLLVDLADGQEMPAHSALLCTRCPFFDGLYNGRAGGRWVSSRRAEAHDTTEAIRVNLTHVDSKIFELVLRHIYADTGEELFDDVVTTDLDELLDVVCEVMFVANELMLDRLAQICQKVLGRYVTIRNICQLLNTVAVCSVNEFKLAGLEYICLNLESMLEHRLLEDLDGDLLLELDETIHQNQLAFMPFARSGRAQAVLLQHHPQLSDQMEEARQRRLDSMRLHTRLNPDEDRPTNSSFRTGSYDRTASSPLARPSRPSLSREPLSPLTSPVLHAMSHEHDHPFEMDDERAANVRTPGLGLDLDMSSPILEAQDSRRTRQHPATPDENEGWLDARGKPIRGSVGPDPPSLPPLTQHRHVKSPMLSATALSPSALTVKGFGTPSTPWKSATQSVSQIGLQEIMGEASLAKTSSLTQSLKCQEPLQVRPKMSQKERKKLQQQHLRSSDNTPMVHDLTPTVQPRTPISKSPWQTLASGSKTSLRDAMGSAAGTDSVSSAVTPSPGPTRPPARATMTMRQTVAGTSPRGADQASPVVRSTSMPTTASTSISAPPQIQSIRHTPAPSRSTLLFDPGQSMADILAQQQSEKVAVQEAVAKRSLQEIQQEQEFLEWWDSERRRNDEEAAKASLPPAGRGKVHRGRSGRRGGRGKGSGPGGSSVPTGEQDRRPSASASTFASASSAHDSHRGSGTARGRGGSTGRGAGRETK